VRAEGTVLLVDILAVLRFRVVSALLWVVLHDLSVGVGLLLRAVVLVLVVAEIVGGLEVVGLAEVDPRLALLRVEAVEKYAFVVAALALAVGVVDHARVDLAVHHH